MPTIMTFVGELFGSLVDLGRIFFADVAFNDPLAFVSFLMGAILVAFSVGVFGYLALGGIGALFTSDSSRRRRRQRG